MKDHRFAGFLMVLVMVVCLIGVASPIFAESTSSAAPGYSAPVAPKQSARQEPSKAALPPGTAATTYTFSYYRVMGSGFNPRQSTTVFSGNSGELVVNSVPSGDAIFHVPVYLPQGTMVTGFIWYYWRPDLVTGGTVWLTQYNRQTGGVVQEWYQICDTFTGFDWNVKYFNHTIDNSLYVYMLNYRPDANSYNANMQFMSMGLYANIPRTNQTAVIPLY